MGIADRDYMREGYKTGTGRKQGLSLRERVRFMLWRLVNRLFSKKSMSGDRQTPDLKL